MFTDEYFERQLQQIREIRLSERKFYQKVTDLYATAFDYDKNRKDDPSVLPDGTEQNALCRPPSHGGGADRGAGGCQQGTHGTDYMGECSGWEILKADVTIAKNYLSKEEMNYLERIVSLYLDYAELQAERKIPSEHGRLGKAAGWFSGVQRQ